MVNRQAVFIDIRWFLADSANATLQSKNAFIIIRTQVIPELESIWSTALTVTSLTVTRLLATTTLILDISHLLVGFF